MNGSGGLILADTKLKKLNLGCGKDIKQDYVNLDCVKLPGVDVVHNINKLPLPFRNNEFDEILCRHFLEHLADIDELMKELYRILKPGGVLKIIVPHFTCAGSWLDPQHKRPFGYFSFDFFSKDASYEAARLNTHEHAARFSSQKRRLIFGKKYQVWNYVIEWIANKFPYVYEDTPLRIFPAIELKVELTK